MNAMIKPKVYGLKHVREVLGFESALELMESTEDDCPSVCSACGNVNESGHEPDAAKYDCEECGAKGTVNSVLILMGVI